MKFYADENFPLFVVAELRNLGHDCLTAFEDGKANQKIPNEQVLERAIELERIVLTLNRKDFKKLHQTNNQHFGIVNCTFDADFIGQASRINEKVSEFETLEGELVSIYRPGK